MIEERTDGRTADMRELTDRRRGRAIRGTVVFEFKPGVVGAKGRQSDLASVARAGRCVDSVTVRNYSLRPPINSLFVWLVADG
jgi:hypothetical protein